MQKTNIIFSNKWTSSDLKQYPVMIIGQLPNLKKLKFDHIRIKLEPYVTEENWAAAVSSLHPSPTDTCPLFLNLASISALPLRCTRHNTSSRSHSVTKIVKNLTSGVDETIVLVCEYRDVFASACAIARAFPTYSRKSASLSNSSSSTVTVEFVIIGNSSNSESVLTEKEIACLQSAAAGIRLSSHIVDVPCNEMHTDNFLEEVINVGKQLDITPLIIQGEELQRRGFGGIYGVGKAAEHLPALAVLSHTPFGATQTIAWVGKGIVYDTGGLSIKAKTAMTGMKRDCGGAAAVLGAFCAAVKQGFRENLHAVFCLAENAVGPKATRPDDIHTLYSGRTVEINNTDAEGRLVLSDGVAYAQRDLKANIILDMATLTGAQGIATGKYHAAVITNSGDWEMAAVEAGCISGDLVHPLPFCPELHYSEFGSAVADMKNSVADRSNAQPSCAALFILSHLGFDFPGIWIHVDMAYPVHCGERATGYGVALLLTLFGHFSSDPFLQSICPFSGPNEENANKKIRLT